ncbi:HsmA family protein [Geomonas anaerohicana]|nr:HsmA family protein [Geomonas anaerohicana]
MPSVQGSGPMLAVAIFWMTLALIFYTWAVFSGRRQGLRTKHLVIFGIGLLCDYIGTHQMNLYAQAFGKAPQIHNITGLASLSGMAFHFLLALAATLAGRADAVNRVFHRVSLTIYSCWLIAFFSGAFSGMMRLHR